MLKYTANNLSKVEDIFKSRGYILRYEKGNFNSGYCLLENKKVIIINKYFDNEAKVNCLIDIFNQIDIDFHELNENERHLLEQFESKTIQ
jgi:hypothetical protein